MGGFYGAIVKANEAMPYVPRPLAEGEPSESLHVAGCSIPADCDVKPGTRISLMLKQEDDPPICVATLTCGHNDSLLTSLILESYAELSIVSNPKNSKAMLHVHGSFTANEAAEDDEDEENMTGAQLMQKQLQSLVGMPSGLGEIDDGEGSSSDDEDDSEDGAGDSDGDADGDEEDENGEKIVTRYGGKRRVQVTMLPDDDKADGGKATDKRKAVKGTTAELLDAIGEDNDDDSDSGSSEDGSDDEDADERADHAKNNGAQGGALGTREAEMVAAAKAAIKGGEVAAAAADKSEEEEEEDSGDEDDEDEDASSDEGSEDDVENEDEEVKKEPGATNGKRKASSPASAVPAAKRQKHSVFSNGFEVHEVAAGPNPNAALAKPGARVSVRYTGTLKSNGKVFDKTKSKPFTFRLGVGEVIKGWDKGVAGMRVGDKRKLVVPPSMAYGDTGVRGLIPKDSTLCFDVELCGVH